MNEDLWYADLNTDNSTQTSERHHLHYDDNQLDQEASVSSDHDRNDDEENDPDNHPLKKELDLAQSQLDALMVTHNRLELKSKDMETQRDALLQNLASLYQESCAQVQVRQERLRQLRLRWNAIHGIGVGPVQSLAVSGPGGISGEPSSAIVVQSMQNSLPRPALEKQDARLHNPSSNYAPVSESAPAPALVAPVSLPGMVPASGTATATVPVSPHVSYSAQRKQTQRQRQRHYHRQQH